MPSIHIKICSDKEAAQLEADALTAGGYSTVVTPHKLPDPPQNTGQIGGVCGQCAFSVESKLNAAIWVVIGTQ